MRSTHPLLSKSAFVGWFFLGEAVLGFLHLGEFTMNLVKDLFAWFQSNFWMDLIFGLAILLVTDRWGVIKPRIPSWMKIKTVHDHLHEIRECHKAVGQRLDSAEEAPNTALEAR